MASWLLVVAALGLATFVITAEHGVGYFLVYAVLGATLFGLGIPLAWMVLVRKRPLADLGLTTKRWRLALPLQFVLAMLLYLTAFRDVAIPPANELIPLIALALAIGFFEAVFWRGWVLLRVEESFGLVPALLVGSLLYAAYHIGYGMALNEMVFLFFVGVLFAVVFRLVGTVLVLWPLFQPLGQLATLIRDGLELPLLAALGFGEVLLVMLVLVWLAHRYQRRHPSERHAGRPSVTTGHRAP
jgi:membrane protease YdiL (CAAX protease family)